MSLFGKLLPIIAGLGVTAATGGFGAPLGAAIAGGGLAGGAAAGGLAGAAGAAGAGAAAGGLAAAAPIAAEAASAAPALSSALAPALAHTVAAPAITPAIGAISAATPALPAAPGFASQALSFLGNHPEAAMMMGGALLGDKPKPAAPMSLNAAPSYNAPQAQPMKAGGIPDRSFQQSFLSNLVRR